VVVTRSMLTDEWTHLWERPGLTGTEHFAGRDAFSYQLLAVCDVLCTAITCPEGLRRIQAVCCNDRLSPPSACGAASLNRSVSKSMICQAMMLGPAPVLPSPLR